MLCFASHTYKQIRYRISIQDRIDQLSIFWIVITNYFVCDPQPHCFRSASINFKITLILKHWMGTTCKFWLMYLITQTIYNLIPFLYLSWPTILTDLTHNPHRWKTLTIVYKRFGAKFRLFDYFTKRSDSIKALTKLLIFCDFWLF